MDVVIIGNSAGGLSALESMRKYDNDVNITMISKESVIPYSRVLLSYYLSDKTNNIFIRDEDYYEKHNTRILHDEVIAINDKDKSLKLKSGEIITYDKLLISTGAKAIRPPIDGMDNENIFNLWTLDDVMRIKPFFKKDNSLIILGSGFVALQTAYVAIKQGLDVHMIEIQDRIMNSVLDEQGSSILTEKLKENNINLHLNAHTSKVESLKDGKLRVHLEDHVSMDCDFLLVCTGVKADLSITKNTNIKTDKGILANKYLETSVKDIFVAGDVAQIHGMFSDEKKVVSLWFTAVSMGRIAGLNLLGKNIPHKGNFNMNITEMFGLTIASIGEFNSSDHTSEYIYNDHLYGYIKIAYKNNKIVGAVGLGTSRIASFLSQIKIAIEKQKYMDPAEFFRLESGNKLTLAHASKIRL